MSVCACKNVCGTSRACYIFKLQNQIIYRILIYSHYRKAMLWAVNLHEVNFEINYILPHFYIAFISYTTVSFVKEKYVLNLKLKFRTSKFKLPLQFSTMKVTSACNHYCMYTTVFTEGISHNHCAGWLAKRKSNKIQGKIYFYVRAYARVLIKK